jgi:hypothetical protein
VCAAGYSIVASSIYGRLSNDTWHWLCRSNSNPDKTSSCHKACPAGTNYEPNKKSCAVDCPDWCPNVDGNQTTLSGYQRDDAGHCLLPDAQIVSFKPKPNVTKTTCPIYWDTDVSPIGTLSCKINGNPVSEKLIESSGAGFDVPPGKYTLECEVRTKKDNVLIKTISAKTRCYRNGEVIEQ